MFPFPFKVLWGAPPILISTDAKAFFEPKKRAGLSTPFPHPLPPASRPTGKCLINNMLILILFLIYLGVLSQPECLV